VRYLLIQFFRKPNGQIDEQVSVSKRLKTADLQTCNIIVDYKDRVVQKCIVEGRQVNSEFDTLNEYYKKIYPVLVTQLNEENQKPAE
jgi:hypothetical protein